MINKKIQELPNIPSPESADLLALYDVSGEVTGNITFTQAIQLINDNQGGFRVGFNPVSFVSALSGIDVTDYNTYFNNGVINAGGRLFYLDRNSTLDEDGVNIVSPLAGPGNFIAFNPISTDVVTLFYDAETTYDNSGTIATTYTEYNLKTWKYINVTPTDEAARITALGSGTPQENVYWTEVSKSDIPNLGGDVTGTLNNVIINKASVSQINNEADGRFVEAGNLGDSKYLTQGGEKISATASGTNTYVAALTPAIASYVAGATYYIKFTNANTGAATLNLNSLGAKSIKKNVSTALVSGDILAGQVMPLNYDGTNFQIIGGGGSGSGSYYTIEPTVNIAPSLVSVDDGGSNTTRIQPTNVDSKSFSAGFQTLIDGANINWDVALSQNAKVTLGGNRNLLNATNFNTGTELCLEVIQDATGGRTLTFGSLYKFPTGFITTLNPGANERTVFVFEADGTDLIYKSGGKVISSSAADISNTPAGNISSTNVQAAINELDTEKEAIANKDTLNGYVGLSGWSIKFRNLANSFTSFLQNAATAVRTYTFPDKNITVAGLDDIPAIASQSENEAAATASTSTDASNSVASSPRGIYWFWTKAKTLAQTFAAQITFTLAPRFSSVTASRILKVDANKDLTSGTVSNAELDTMPALSIKVNATNATAAATDLQATVAERIPARTASNTIAWVQATTNMLLDLAVTTAKVAANAITLGKMAQLAANKVIANVTGGAADPQAVDIVDVGSALFSRATTSTNYTMTGAENVLAVKGNTGAITITFAAVTSYTEGKVFWIKDEEGTGATNNLSFAASGSDTIDDNTSISTNKGKAAFYSDGISKFYRVV